MNFREFFEAANNLLPEGSLQVEFGVWRFHHCDSNEPYHQAKFRIYSEILQAHFEGDSPESALARFTQKVKEYRDPLTLDEQLARLDGVS